MGWRIKGFRERRRPGITLAEALCSLIILSVALLGITQVLAYSMTLTMNSRVSAERFSMAEEAGLRAWILKNPAEGELSNIEVRKALLTVSCDASYGMEFQLAVYRAGLSGSRSNSKRAPAFLIAIAK